MKSQILRSTMITAIIAIVAAAAYGQHTSRLIAEIPFDFYVKGQKISAGTYEIEKVNPNTNQPIVAFRHRSDGKTVTMVSLLAVDPRDVQTSEGPCLVFDQIDSRYVLAEIRNPGANFAAQAPRARTKERVRKGNSSPPTVITAVVR